MKIARRVTTVIVWFLPELLVPNYPVTTGSNLKYQIFLYLKGLSHEIFRLVFLACMDASRPECEPLLLLKLLWCSFNFLQLFSALVRFIPNLLIESPRRVDNWIRGSLLSRDTIWPYVVEEHSRRTPELVVNHSRRFYESPRSSDTLCSVSWRTTNPEKNKNWRTTDSVVNPSWRFKTYQYLNWL